MKKTYLKTHTIAWQPAIKAEVKAAPPQRLRPGRWGLPVEAQKTIFLDVSKIEELLLFRLTLLLHFSNISVTMLQYIGDSK